MVYIYTGGDFNKGPPSGRSSRLYSILAVMFAIDGDEWKLCPLLLSPLRIELACGSACTIIIVPDVSRRFF